MARKRSQVRKPYDPVKHLRVGVNYRLVYKSFKGNGQLWEMETVAKFVGFNRDETETYWSHRPEAGTSALVSKNILEAYEMPHISKPKLPVNRKRIETS